MNRRLAALASCLLLLAGCGDDATAPAPEPDPPVETVHVSSADFVPYRFFRLDRPALEPQGRDVGEESIDPASVLVFRRTSGPPPGPDTILNLAAYADSAGCHAWAARDDYYRPELSGHFWDWIPFTPVLGKDGRLVGIDLGPGLDESDAVAVTYSVVDGSGWPTAWVGDSPFMDPPGQAIEGESDLYYRVKLLKAPSTQPDPVSGRLEMRNVYSLGGANLDPLAIELEIEAPVDSPLPQMDEQNIPYIALFGLDRRDLSGQAIPDGWPDFHDPTVFDLARGLVFFPGPHGEPFAAEPGWYESNAFDPSWTFAGSGYLAAHLAPELYDPLTPRAELARCGHFRIVCEFPLPEAEGGRPPKRD